jgi:hypothetical protein
MTPTTPSSGAADRAIEDCPELNMGNYDEVEVERLNDWAIRANDEIDRLHALAAGQATAAPAQPAAQQGVAYAALPTSNYAGRVYEEGFLIGTCPLYTADQMRAFADATCALRASHGQAPASVLHLVHSAFAEIAMAFPKAFALHKVGIADTAVREALAAPARKQGATQ